MDTKQEANRRKTASLIAVLCVTAALVTAVPAAAAPPPGDGESTSGLPLPVLWHWDLSGLFEVLGEPLGNIFDATRNTVDPNGEAEESILDPVTPTASSPQEGRSGRTPAVR